MSMDPIPQIAAQPGIYIADKLSEFDNTFVVAHFLELFGDLEVEALQSAIMQGMAETDTLQMQFTEVDGEAVQIPRGSALLPHPEVVNLSTSSDALTLAHEIIREDGSRNARSDSGNPLIRHVIIKTGEKQWIWYQRYHHLHVDAYSFTALTRRMADLYTAKVRNSLPKLPPLTPIQTAVEEYLDYERSAKFTKDSQFWQKYCAELPPAHSLAPVAGAAATKHIIRSGLRYVSRENFAKLCEQGPAADMALGLVVLWLMRICNCTEMSLGFILMRRLGSAALNAAGAFINVLPMAVSGTTVTETAASVNKALKVIRRHQKINSEQIVRDTGRNWDTNPLFGPVINFKAFDYQLDFEGLEAKTHHLASGPIRDIELVIFVNEQQELTVEYLANGDRYEKETLDRHLDRLDLLLDEIVHGTPQNIVLPSEISVITAANKTKTEGCADETLISLIEHQVRCRPQAVALQDTLGRNLSYQQMNERVEKMAAAMCHHACVARGDIVAVKLPRSLELSLALQAVMRLGAAYLPLDPGYPEDRLAMMIEDAQPKFVITPENIGQLTSDQPIYNVSKPQTTDIAYIIYTSGSTGKPKGVMVSHEAIVNRLVWMQTEYQLNESDVVLQKTPSSFDVSVWEFFWPLIAGAQCLMAPPDAHRDPEQVRTLIIDHRVTTIHFVPSMLSTFMPFANGVSKSLRRTFCSGEALPVTLAQIWENNTGVPLYNLYGPTEAAIDVTAYPAFGTAIANLKGTSVPIGRPVFNTQMHVLDTQMRPLPISVAGDLYIGGIQLAKGYLNRPELTAERFVDHDGERLYFTGDLARWLDNGELEFLGRSDEQVKIRGQRIELGEIDACMEAQLGVEQAVTHPQVFGGVAQSDKTVDARQLVGYLVVDAKSFDLENLQAELSKALLAYMVPVKFVILDKLPLTPTGKLARNQLPPVQAESNSHNLESAGDGRPPAPGIEEKIAQTYETLLNVPYVSASDDFFSLGGHSLLAVKLAAQLRTKLGRPVTIGQIMQSPRVDKLAAQIASGDAGDNAGFENILPLRPTSGPKVFCIHPASGFAWQFSVLRRYLDPQWSLIGIQSTQNDSAMGGAKNLADVVDAHYKTITEYEPNGPYYLLGYSLGGTLAHSLAARLKREGKQVNFLGLLDTWPPETQNWDEKRGENVLDQAVVDEMNRERQQFLTVNLDDGFSTRMFDAIEANYSTAVRLLVTASSDRFEGNTVLFVAKKTLPDNTDLQDVWRPWTQTLTTVDVQCSHIDIIHPSTFKVLGPQINKLLDASQSE